MSYDAIDFYNFISKMSNEDLTQFEKDTYRELKDITIKYISFIKNAYEPSLDYLMKESQEDFFCYLLTIRDMMYKRKLEMPDRFPHKFLLSVLLIKTKKGY